MSNTSGGVESLGELIHKEKKQKKYNKTTGQYDNLKKYASSNKKSNAKLTTDKLIEREANYIKNIHIDESVEKLYKMGLITDDKYRAWWCGTMHKLGVQYVMVQADLALKNGRKPAALFHFMINKQLNKSADPFAPRF